MSKIINQNSLYVLVTIIVSGVGFVRSFLFMKWLDLTELGILSLVQTVIMFLSLFQLGLINGGYRIFALDKLSEQRQVNNVLFSYFSAIGVIAIVFWIILAATDTMLVISNKYMLLALICGILSLMQNWLTNTLIGKRLIKDINKINIISASSSLVVILLIFVWGIDGAIISLIMQPLLFVLVTLIKHHELRPTAWNFDIKLIRCILSFGFIPFLAGIFVLINIQIERWSIADILGVEELGKFYLVFLYSMLFVLIPSSINSLFFPKSIKAYEDRNIGLFKLNLKRYTLILGSYLFVVVLMTLFLLQPVIDWMLPQHSENTIYVFYYLPGLIALTLCDPIGLVMNSVVKLRPMLIAGSIGVIANIALVIITKHFGVFSLSMMVLIKNVVNFILFISYVIFIIRNYKTIFHNDYKWNN